MKTEIAAVVSLLAGVALGWFGERRHAEHDKTQIVREMVEGIEISDRERALRAVRAIESIQSGNTQKAIDLLSTPVAHYYTIYTEPGSKEERRAETRALIEQLAKSNQTVAARIVEHSNDAQVRTP